MSLLINWREEKQSAYLYRVMQDVEPDHVKGDLFLALAEAAEDQSKIWEKSMLEQGMQVPARYDPQLRVRIVGRLVRQMGPRRLLPVLAAMKVRGLSVYKSGPISGGHAMPTSVDDIGHRHKAMDSGGNFRAAVFGVNDGLVSNACLILGVAGATQHPNTIILTGVAGLLAGAFSMAAGEYVSMRSQRELYEYQIGLEREELEEYPEEEAEELALIYHARGVPKDQARRIAADIMQDKEQALDTLSRAELGLNPDDLGSPLGAALASFSAFACGALVPLLPYIVLNVGMEPATLLWLSAGFTSTALFVVGASISMFTGLSAWHSGLRMVLIGGGAGVLTYFIGMVLGVRLV